MGFSQYFELVDCEVAFAGPRIDPRQVGYKICTVNTVFCDGTELDRPPALAQRVFFSPQCRVNDPQKRKQAHRHQEQRAPPFLLLHARP